MHLGVVDGDGGLRGDAGQQVEIVLLKPLPLVGRVDLNHPQGMPFAVDQRGAHQRANPQVGNALARLKADVGGRIGREQRLLALHRLIDDRAADPHPIFHLGVATLDGLGNQRPVGRRPQDDEAPIGLREDLEHAVEQLGQHFLERDRAGQVLRDLDHRLQLHLGIDDRRERSTGGASVDLRHDGRVARPFAVVDHFGLARRPRAAGLRPPNSARASR